MNKKTHFPHGLHAKTSKILSPSNKSQLLPQLLMSHTISGKEKKG